MKSLVVETCNIRMAAIVCLVLVISSCRKFIQVDVPITSLQTENVFSSDATAAAALTGIYSKMGQGSFSTGATSISFLLGLSADELTLFGTVSNINQLSFYKNSLASNTAGYEIWLNIYPFVYSCNSAIEGLNKSSTLNPIVKKQLEGEAKFLRAFYYFYLVNLYGDVPLVLSTDYKVNSMLPRSSVADVYQQIVNDLKDAQNLLSTSYLKSDASTPYPSNAVERLRPTKWAATALLARVYLYTGNYLDAETEATKLINNSALFSLVPLNKVFLKNSTEVIWQLQPVNAGWNTEDAKIFILPATGPSSGLNPAFLKKSLVNSFEVDDQRKIIWVGSVTPTSPGGITYYFPYKYKANSISPSAPASEYLMVFRVAELYLIRSTARAKLNNIVQAQADLNLIRSRAGLPNSTANDTQSLLEAIMRERQIELFSEWGHRWLDLKITGNINAVMKVETPLKSNGAQWESYQQLFPIPNDDIQRGANITQNPGY